MLTFLNSAILFGLAAVAIPVLIHLFTRQKSKIIYFSSLRFLKELQKQKIRRLKIRQILLLILRILIILLLVLAFARPTSKSSDARSLESGAKLTAVIILDNTLSMGRAFEGRLLLDLARDRALDVVSLLRQGDELYLLYPQDPPKFAHEGPRYNVASIREMIENTELSFSRTNYADALQTASEIMNASQNINKEIYLISDMQQNGLKFGDNNNGHMLLSADVRLLVLPVLGADSENLSISRLTIGNQILETGKVAEVEVRVRNASQQRVRNRLVHLFVNGKRSGQDLVDLEAGASANLLFRVVPERTGFQSGYVLLEDDALMADNRRYFAFHISEEIPVLLVGKEARDTRFIKLALRPQKEMASYVKMRTIGHKDFAGEDLSQYKVVIFSNVPGLNMGEVARVESFVKTGGGLMIFLGADVDLRNYNQNLHRKLKLPVLTERFGKRSEDEFLSFGKIDFSHAIFKGVFEGEKVVASPHVRFAVDINPRNTVDTIIEYSNGAPFLFESKLQNGRVLYITTSVSSGWSDLVFKGVFVPLINRSVFYLAGAASAENEQVVVGGELKFASEKMRVGADLLMETPAGTQIKLKAEVSGGRYFVRFKDTSEPGIYRLLNGGVVMAQWAVNYDPEESDHSIFELDELAKYIEADQMVELDADADLAQALEQARFGREFWKALIAVTLVLLLLESVLSKDKWLKKDEN